jgi:hypothetical protein
VAVVVAQLAQAVVVAEQVAQAELASAHLLQV